jgi:hypothetical protein
MGISIVVGLLVLLRQIQIPFYLYYPNTTNTVLISEPLDVYIFLVTSLCVPGTLLTAPDAWRDKVRSAVFMISALWFAGIILLPVTASYGIPITYLAVIILALAKFKKRPQADERSGEVAYFIVGATSIIALIECASVYYWVAAAFAPQALFGVASQNLETNLTYAAYPIAPLLLLIIMFSWVWVPIMGRLMPRLQASQIDAPAHSDNPVGRSMSDRRLLFLSLDVFAILSILVFYFLYAAGQLWVVGVDSQYRYIIPLNALNGSGFFHALGASLSLGHGIYLGLLLIVEHVTGLSSFLVVKYAPLVLTFFTAILSFLAFRGVLSRNFPLLAALSMILWIPTTIGIWSGIQSNWTAYALWIFFLACVFQYVKSRAASFLLQSLLSLGILVIHPWTWGVFLATVILATLFGIRRRTDFKHGLTAVVSSIWLAAPIGAVAFIYLSGVSGDIRNAITLYLFPLAHVDLVFKLFPGAWLEMWREWSSFLSPTLILIALMGTFALIELHGEMKRYLLAWVAVWCIGSILVAAIGYLPADAAISETQLWRMLYLSPLPILLALGVSKFVNLSPRFILTGPSRVLGLQAAVLSATIGASSLPLFLFATPIIRLGCVMAGTLAVLLLTYHFHMKDSPKLMILTVLILIIMNAAFRSLFPLLLDPHNLIPPSSI